MSSSVMDVQWTAEARAELEEQLRVANGRRAARVMTMGDVESCIATALTAPLGFHWQSAGETADARAVTTLCLAVIRDDELTVALASAHGDVTPASAWSDLTVWHRHEPSANRPAVLAWAGRRRPDRVHLPLVVPAQPEATTPEALRQRILARPDDVAARLVYADLISETGDPRGEFIALQCGPDDALHAARAEELLAEHGARWVPHPDASVALTFSRGFVSELRCTNVEAMADVERICRDEPVEHLSLRGPRLYDLGALSAWPSLQRLRTLSLTLTNTAALVDGLVTMRTLTSVRWGQLRHLSFRGHRLGDEAFHLLAEAQPRAFPQLNALTVEQDTVTAAGVGELLNARAASRLEQLSLAENLLGPSGADVIAASRRLGRLEHLSLAGNGLGSAGALTLAATGGLRSLRALDLRRNGISAAGVQALLRSHHLRQLESLELLGNPIGRAAWSEVRQRFPDSPRRGEA